MRTNIERFERIWREAPPRCEVGRKAFRDWHSARRESGELCVVFTDDGDIDSVRSAWILGNDGRVYIANETSESGRVCVNRVIRKTGRLTARNYYFQLDEVTEIEPMTTEPISTSQRHFPITGKPVPRGIEENAD